MRGVVNSRMDRQRLSNRSRSGHGWAYRQPALGADRVQLFLTSAALLFTELFLIRWIPANVIYVGFFTNLILLASFLGIGAGIILGRRWPGPWQPMFPLMLFGVIKFVTVAQITLHLGSIDDILIGPNGSSGAADGNVVVLVLVALLATMLMGALALPLGGLLKSMPPLRAYAIDILGSLTGIAGFTLLSLMGTSPAIWLVALGVLLALIGLGRGITAWSALSMAALGASLLVLAGSTDIWSPYQRLTVFEAGGDVVVDANGIPHQQFPLARAPLGFFYTQVDQWFPGHKFSNDLIIGAGTGNDVAVAVARGDGHIDAVEIDPSILALGVARHPYRPYQNASVTTIVDDGRAYLKRTTKTYDIVTLGQPDSLTLLSTASGIRLESFLFTQEAFSEVKAHLTPNGIFVLYNFYWQPWLVDRLGTMLEQTFGRPTIIARYGTSGHAAVLMNGPGLDGTLGVPAGAEVMHSPPAEILPTDNWPFLYLRTPGIASQYIAAVVLIVVASTLIVLLASWAVGLRPRQFSPHFFWLGAAFMLLETRSLVLFGLLFGNTWVVNSLVFFAILGSVLAAIAISARVTVSDPRRLYIALFAFLSLTWLVPPQSLLIDPQWLRYAVAAALAFTPVFLANLCFTYSFKDTSAADMSFASNLLGAVFGGLLEYAALITGYQALVLLVMLLYGAALVAATRVRLFADRALGRPT